jgi:Tol biopolymer transport system component
MDTAGRFSPDASQVAFVSDRGGNQQVWVAGRDGSALRSVTNMPDATMSVGSWSPDGQWIAFDGTIAGNSDIYVVRADGGTIRRLTTSTAAQIDPEWSHDGRTIYFSSNESGSSAIWRIPASGGTPVRLSSEPGFDPRESPDGRTIYFLDRVRWFGFGATAVLKQMPTAGGAASTVDIAVSPGAWDVTDRGIVFAMPRLGVLDPSPAPDVVALYDFADHRVRPLGELNFRIAPFGTSRFLIASRDGRWALGAHVDHWDRDIMVIDNFR